MVETVWLWALEDFLASEIWLWTELGTLASDSLLGTGIYHDVGTSGREILCGDALLFFFTKLKIKT